MEQMYFLAEPEGYLELTTDTYYVIDCFGCMIEVPFSLHSAWHYWDI
jgi:hypothetical protein